MFDATIYLECNQDDVKNFGESAVEFQKEKVDDRLDKESMTSCSTNEQLKPSSIVHVIGEFSPDKPWAVPI